jgi:hypothetical protein
MLCLTKLIPATRASAGSERTPSVDAFTLPKPIHSEDFEISDDDSTSTDRVQKDDMKQSYPLFSSHYKVESTTYLLL